MARTLPQTSTHTAPLVPANPDIIDIIDADDKEKSSPVDSGSEENSCETDDEEPEEEPPLLDGLITMATAHYPSPRRCSSHPESSGEDFSLTSASVTTMMSVEARTSGVVEVSSAGVSSPRSAA
ncbi:hypothetical protein BGW42_005885 [Actinomortierella wolfii]|nr:hypothetical protein BGW42_005885 [Actinomortierella wolfii]